MMDRFTCASLHAWLHVLSNFSVKYTQTLIQNIVLLYNFVHEDHKTTPYEDGNQSNLTWEILKYYKIK